ncbi:hypothetical protein B0T26DRAFT_676728 [Lasiosphaeria miniovina]|uniref:Uncharacterized protein n=1 Tax=Lasiosphaeria miniovina TaxID=1954250 RepID=A0AA40AMN8_9PEZI|nr:uncharacterized protein B0T26DRAFT_676728 [Lasiosphaeria miniovina]KAK0718575.1 hypothetical protein B0T26DRAFT_676728 [Lasiosphaeria miniovina]
MLTSTRKSGPLRRNPRSRLLKIFTQAARRSDQPHSRRPPDGQPRDRVALCASRPGRVKFANRRQSNQHVEEVNAHFGQKPILGAINHLRSKDHGWLILDASDAIEKLGIRVLNCNVARAERNNNAFVTALKSGYKVLEGRSPDDPGDVLHSATTTEYRDDNNREESEPTARELHLAYWRGASPGWYAAVVLTLGSFEALGISGTISNTSFTKSHIPVCFKSDQKTRTISGWAEGYEDGVAKVTMRKFPVMYFGDDQVIPMEGLLVPPRGFSDAEVLSCSWYFKPYHVGFIGFDPVRLHLLACPNGHVTRHLIPDPCLLGAVVTNTVVPTLANNTNHIEGTLSNGTPPAECESQSTASVQSSIGWDTVNRNAADVSEDSGDISRGQSNDPL